MGMRKMLTLVCAVVGEGRPFSVEIAAEETVGDLKKLIKEKNLSSIACDADELQLYCVDGLAQIGKTRFDLKGTVIDNMPATLMDDFDGSTSEMVETFLLSTYPTLNDSSVGRIHVLVVVPEGTVSAPHGETLLKKPKLIQKDVGYQGPVTTEEFCVPMETIDVYRKLTDLYSSAEKLRPLCLLYGPRQFGKITIGHRLWELFASDSSVLVSYHAATEISVRTEIGFWIELSRFCGEVATTPQEFMNILLHRKKRLLLIVDAMDAMFANNDLTSIFFMRLYRSPYIKYSRISKYTVTRF